MQACLGWSFLSLDLPLHPLTVLGRMGHIYKAVNPGSVCVRVRACVCQTQNIGGTP